MNVLSKWILAHPYKYASALSLVTAASTVTLLHYLNLL